MTRQSEEPGLLRRSKATLLGCAVAVLALAAVSAVALVLRLSSESSLLLLVAMIALVSWFTGFAPGLLAAIGSAGLASILYLPFPGTPAASLVHLLCWGTFLLMAVLMGWEAIMPPALGRTGRFRVLFANSRARSALASQRALLEAVLRQMPEGVVVAEAANGKILLRNEQALRILRGAGEEPNGVEDFVRKLAFRRRHGRPYGPGDWPLARALWRGEIVTGEELEIDTNRGTRTLRVSAAPVLSLDGSLAAGVATFSDLTEQRRTEEAQRFLVAAGTALASSLDYSKTMCAVARLAIPALADWCLVDLLDDDGRIRHVAEAHVEKEKEQLLRELAVKSAEGPEGMRLVRTVLETGKTVLSPEVNPENAAEPAGFSEFRLIGASSALTVPLRARGKTLGAISLFYSVSGRRYSAADLDLAEDLARRAALALDNARLYREAQEANRIKDEFLATVSHELRTPLHAVLGWTRLLRTREMGPGMAAHALEVIERNASAQHKLIDDILDLSRLIRGRLRLTMRPMDLAPVIEHVIAACLPAAEAKRIRIDFFPAPDTGAVSGDPDRLQQVFWNLLSNAIKFTPDSGTVQVQLRQDGQSAQVVVADTGRGIPAHVLPHIFERFRQGDGTTARRYGGLGLGLAIVRHTVEMHGGSVHADSAGEGLGARFVVSLPVKEPRKPLPAASEARVRMQ